MKGDWLGSFETDSLFTSAAVPLLASETVNITMKTQKHYIKPLQGLFWNKSKVLSR